MLQRSNPHARCTPCITRMHDTHTQTHARTHTPWHARTRADTSTLTDKRARAHTHIHTHTHIDTRTQPRTNAHTNVHTHARKTRPRRCARADTHTHARIHTKNLFSRTFCTSREYCDYGYLKVLAGTSIIGHPFNFEIPVITVFSQGTEGCQKQILRVSVWV